MMPGISEILHETAFCLLQTNQLQHVVTICDKCILKHTNNSECSYHVRRFFSVLWWKFPAPCWTFDLILIQELLVGHFQNLTDMSGMLEWLLFWNTASILCSAYVKGTFLFSAATICICILYGQDCSFAWNLQNKQRIRMCNSRVFFLFSDSAFNMDQSLLEESRLSQSEDEPKHLDRLISSCIQWQSNNSSHVTEVNDGKRKRARSHGSSSTFQSVG